MSHLRSGRLQTDSPLAVAFASERPVYPLKFSTHQGTFALTLWVITRKPPANLKEVRKGHKLQVGTLRMAIPKSVRLLMSWPTCGSSADTSTADSIRTRRPS